MDPIQILLIIVVIVLTFILLLLGVQVFFILREFKETVMKLNKVLDDAGVISESVATPVSNISSVMTGVKTGMSFINLFMKKKKKKSMQGEETDE